MSIKTDSLGLDEPKDPENCNVFKLYKLLASDEKTKEMAVKYKVGNYGYGHAKQELFGLICDEFSEPRNKFNQLMSNTDIIELELTYITSKILM